MSWSESTPPSPARRPWRRWRVTSGRSSGSSGSNRKPGSTLRGCSSISRSRGAPIPPLQAHANPLVERLLGLLYQHAYCRRFRGALAPEPAYVEDDGKLAAALSEANAGAERIDRGWMAEAVLPNGAVVARKGVIARTFFPGEFNVPGLRGQPVAPGASVHAVLAHESWSAQPGFYFAFGQSVGDEQDDRLLVRFYWNVDHPNAAALLHEITAALNRFEVPFRLKCPVHPAAYARCDTMVLYLSRRHAAVGSGLCARVRAAQGDRLREETPLFTRRLARGLAFAEDPGGVESFGTQRVRLLAEGLWKGFAEGVSSDEARLQTVFSHLEANGVSTSEPWRCRADGSKFDFSAFDSAPKGE